MKNIFNSKQDKKTNNDELKLITEQHEPHINIDSAVMNLIPETRRGH
jgi:hypothetical protein